MDMRFFKEHDWKGMERICVVQYSDSGGLL
jgi:hypothetical protein